MIDLSKNNIKFYFTENKFLIFEIINQF